jgi:hypothetical protein
LNNHIWRIVRIAMLARLPVRPASTPTRSGSPAQSGLALEAEVLLVAIRDDRPPVASRRWRTADRVLRLVSVGILVVVAAVAVGAASHPHPVDLSLSSPQLGELAVLALLALAGTLGLSLGANLFPVWGANETRFLAIEKGRRMPGIVKAILALVPFMVIAFVLAASGRLAGDAAPSPMPIGGQFPAGDSTGASSNSSFLLVSAVVVGVAFFLVAAFLFRKPRVTAQIPAEEGHLAIAILDEGLGVLLAERDPRRAVVAAYVAMERAMARHGWARRPHEAPTEYLAHVLGVAPSRAGDLDELVGLYEFARFSEHTVTDGMRESAVAVVRRLRMDLQEPV